MRKKLRNILTIGAIGLAGLLPMKGAEAQSVNAGLTFRAMMSHK